MPAGGHQYLAYSFSSTSTEPVALLKERLSLPLSSLYLQCIIFVHSESCELTLPDSWHPA